MQEAAHFFSIAMAEFGREWFKANATALEAALQRNVDLDQHQAHLRAVVSSFRQRLTPQEWLNQVNTMLRDATTATEQRRVAMDRGRDASRLQSCPVEHPSLTLPAFTIRRARQVETREALSTHHTTCRVEQAQTTHTARSAIATRKMTIRSKSRTPRRQLTPPSSSKRRTRLSGITATGIVIPSVEARHTMYLVPGISLDYVINLAPACSDLLTALFSQPELPPIERFPRSPRYISRHIRQCLSHDEQVELDQIARYFHPIPALEQLRTLELLNKWVDRPLEASGLPELLVETSHPNPGPIKLLFAHIVDLNSHLEDSEVDNIPASIDVFSAISLSRTIAAMVKHLGQGALLTLAGVPNWQFVCRVDAKRVDQAFVMIRRHAPAILTMFDGLSGAMCSKDSNTSACRQDWRTTQTVDDSDSYVPSSSDDDSVVRGGRRRSTRRSSFIA